MLIVKSVEGNGDQGLLNQWRENNGDQGFGGIMEIKDLGIQTIV